MVNQNGSQTYVEWLSKTEDFRTIPVPQPVLDRLLEHIATYCPDAAREDFLFLTRNATHPLRANVARDVLRTAVQRAGLQRTSPGSRCGTWPPHSCSMPA